MIYLNNERVSSGELHMISRVNSALDIKKFGNTINCKDILFHTSNSKLVEVANLLGFEETSKIFKINIGGV